MKVCMHDSLLVLRWGWSWHAKFMSSYHYFLVVTKVDKSKGATCMIIIISNITIILNMYVHMCVTIYIVLCPMSSSTSFWDSRYKFPLESKTDNIDITPVAEAVSVTYVHYPVHWICKVLREFERKQEICRLIIIPELKHAILCVSRSRNAIILVHFTFPFVIYCKPLRSVAK